MFHPILYGIVVVSYCNDKSMRPYIDIADKEKKKAMSLFDKQ